MSRCKTYRISREILIVKTGIETLRIGTAQLDEAVIYIFLQKSTILQLNVYQRTCTYIHIILICQISRCR